jgi:hypothetical protein
MLSGFAYVFVLNILFHWILLINFMNKSYEENLKLNIK